MSVDCRLRLAVRHVSDITRSIKDRKESVIIVLQRNTVKGLFDGISDSASCAQVYFVSIIRSDFTTPPPFPKENKGG